MSTVFFYNPWNEMAIADGGNGFLPNSTIKTMEENLAPLMWLFAQPDDIVLTTSQPDKGWLEFIKEISPLLPTFCSLNVATEKIRKKTVFLEKLEPWGWSPRTLKIFEPLLPFLPDDEKQSPNLTWSKEHKDFYGRRTALRVLQTFLQATPNPNSIIDENHLPEIVTHVSQISQHIARWNEIVVKEPHSSSGRGILPIRQAELNKNILQRIEQAIRKSGYVMCEPFFDVGAQFSIQFKIDDHSCRPLSLQAFETNTNGGYIGNWVGKVPVTAKVQQFISTIDLNNLAKTLAEAVLSSGASKFYRGYFGIDTLLYRTPTGNLKLNPCSEINFRKNMGVIAQHLTQFLPDNHYGFFTILNRLNPEHIPLFTELDTLSAGRYTANQAIIPVTPWKDTTYCSVLKLSPINPNSVFIDLNTFAS